MSVILPTQEAEIRRITVQSQPGQIICETLSQKNPSQKGGGGGAGDMAQGIGPEFKPQYHKKKKKKTTEGGLFENFAPPSYFSFFVLFSCNARDQIQGLAHIREALYH
jgi:hypothetical protein